MKLKIITFDIYTKNIIPNEKTAVSINFYYYSNL